MGNVTTEDRYLERYSNFHGGSFMGHSFVVSTLIQVPQDEMETCRANRKTANTYIEEQSETIAKLSKKNETLENRIQVVERNNQTLAMNQVVQSNKFFEQIRNKKQKRKSVAKKVVGPSPEKLVSNNKPKTGTCDIVCDNLVGFYLFDGDVNDSSSYENHGTNKGAKFIADRNRKSILLNGNDDFVIFKDFTTNTGDIDSDSFSISIFVKFVSLSNRWVANSSVKFAMNTIIGSDTSFLDFGYHSYPVPLGYNLQFGTRSTKWQSVMVGDTDPLSFQHIVAVASKQHKKISIYVNGALKGTKYWDGPNVTSNDLMLGKRGIGSWDNSGYANIIVDELRIYNKALTKNEVSLIALSLNYEDNNNKIVSLNN